MAAGCGIARSSDLVRSVNATRSAILALAVAWLVEWGTAHCLRVRHCQAEAGEIRFQR